MISRGDHASFERLFLFYFVKVRSFIDSIIRSTEDAEELAQDIFVKLWENRHSLDPGRQIGSYLYTSARNSALNYLKHKYVHDEYARGALLTGEGSADGGDIIEAKETELLIEMTVAGMPEQRQKIYRMSRMAGRSNEEISQEMNISKKTVENQISLALKDIKRVISLFAFFFS
ncbi:MAG: RNA polymerase sigma-70 factor [Alistipes sp.]|nr:RNA polymerase sigma-70 factor [Alistipes sp.]